MDTVQWCLHVTAAWVLPTTRGGTKFGGGGRLIILYAGKTLAMSFFGQFRVDENKSFDMDDPKESSSHAPRSLIASHLLSCMSEEDLLEVFIPFGPISTVHVCRNELARVSGGFGFINFKHRRDAESTLEALNFSELFGKMVCISWVQDPTIEALLRSSSPQDNNHRSKPSCQGRKLVNTAKNALIGVLRHPEAWIGIGLLAAVYSPADDGHNSIPKLNTVQKKAIDKMARKYFQSQ